MKLITLNTWGGRVGEPFIDFVEKHRDVDIFCFQEIYDQAKEVMAKDYPNDMYEQFADLGMLLPEHDGFFRPILREVYGLAIFIKKNLQVKEEGELLIHDSDSDSILDGHHLRKLQWVKFNKDGKDFTVVNVHGLWNGMGKNDTPERLAQSEMIKGFMDKVDGPKILCGDFNLNPDTESLRMLGENMKDLVKEYSVTSTRTSFYEKPGKFADYIFVSPDIEVKNFKVLPEEVSDHAALFLEI